MKDYPHNVRTIKNENRALGLSLGVVLGSLGRFVAAVLSGVVFFANNAAEEGALVYSLVYNFSYIWPELLISLASSLVPGMDRLVQLMRKNSVR